MSGIDIVPVWSNFFITFLLQGMSLEIAKPMLFANAGRIFLNERWCHRPSILLGSNAAPRRLKSEAEGRALHHRERTGLLLASCWVPMH